MEYSTFELEKIYNNNSLVKASEIIGVSVPTLLKKVKEAGIELKGSGRPYDRTYDKKDITPYMSVDILSYFKDKKEVAKKFSVFLFLLLDNRFVCNKWAGESNVHISNQFGGISMDESLEYFDSFISDGLIESYSINENGFISAVIKDRKRFVLTEDEYIQSLESGE